MRSTIWTLMAATWLAGGGAALAQPAPSSPGPGGPPPHGFMHRGGPDGGLGGWGMGFAAGRMFATADTDHDGQISRDEFTAALAARYAEIDADRDGAVTLDEFRAMRRPAAANRPMPPQREQRAAAMFRALDADGDGRVTLPEASVLAGAMFRAMDRDSNGVINASEVRPMGGPGRQGPRDRPGTPPTSPG